MRKSRRAKRRRGGMAWAVPVVLLALSAGVAALRDQGWKTIPMRPSPGMLGHITDQSSQEGVKPRLVYPYSVVPGGVEDGAEVLEALARDPVVRAHYEGYAAAQARVVLLAEPRMVHVSYRVKDKVYWTRKKVQLKKGEKLITDGKQFLRARCGNRVSDVPRKPVALLEPPEVATDTPLLPLPLVALTKPIEPPVDAPAEEEKEESSALPAPVVTPTVPAGGATVVPVVIPMGGGGGAPGSSSPGAPSGTPSTGSTPPSAPPTTPTSPSPDPPPAPPASDPGSPSGSSSTPSSPTPTSPPGTPAGPPPSTPNSPATPPSTGPGAPSPSSPPSSNPNPSTPSVTPPPAAPPGPLEPPLPGSPTAPNGITPPGPGPTQPPSVDPPPGVPGTTPGPPPVTPVPEPSTYFLIGCGLAAMALLKRRRGC
ncbi:MAG TPA: PEP-CTERM sorting domain-containing protein [Bryobacteraceae bacterium]|nr:PEP-CTERM sorting domain-containing protein [Bryobacteraceae bacterium]HPT25596.1 PEP-CTERM sorting domain-containing protein [Bryobacteraceae bacterium]